MADDIVLDSDTAAEPVEGEIVNENPATTSGTTASGQVFDAESYQAITSSIKQKISMIEAHNKDLFDAREMLNSVLENDETYQEQLKAVKEATKIRNKTKQELLKLQANAELVAKIKDISTTIKELRVGLSADLVAYVNVAGVNEIEDEEGMPREIVFSAKLKSKKFER